MKSNIGNILVNINYELNIKLNMFKKLQKKPTIRSLQKYLLTDEKDKKYLLEIATNNIEIFYLKRTIKYQELFSKLEHDFKLNLPLYVQIGNKLSYALYEYFENVALSADMQPIEKLKKFYKHNSIEIETTNENIDKILNSFLSAWPSKYHGMIKRQREFQNYKKELEKHKYIKVAYEHGDFTSNNIFNIKSNLYLMDFEFSREFQPIGFDLLDYAKSIGDVDKFNDNLYYQLLHDIKYQLIEKINKKIDNNDVNIEIYTTFDDSILQEKWKNLYNKGSNYNLSFEWCYIWIKYFKKEWFDIFIFTIWDNENLVFLAPLYLSKGNLHLIGSNPDLFDSFDLLYTDEKYIKQFYNFIFNHKYQINFKYLDSESILSKELIKYLYQNKIDYDSEIIDTKPRTNFDTFKIKTKEKKDIKRCKNRAINIYNKKLKFSISIEKDDDSITELIAIHKERWNGGPFENIKNYDLFVKEISRTHLVVISKLSIQNQTVAYHLAYKDSNNILNSAIPAYSKKYNDISPGKVLLYEILNYCKNNKDKAFDFGRGAEGYKYWFSNESNVLFNLKTTDSKNIILKMKKFSNKIFDKLYRMFYA